MAKERATIDVGEQLKVLHDPSAPLRRKQEAGRQADDRIHAMVDEARGRVQDMAPEEAREEAEAIRGPIMETRRAVWESIVQEHERERAISESEKALLNWAGRDLAEGREGMEDRLRSFLEQRRKTRQEEDKPLKDLSDALMDLQQQLVHAYGVGREGQAGALRRREEAEENGKIVEKAVRAAEAYGCTIQAEDVRSYLYRDSRSAGERLRGALGEDGRKVMGYLDDAHDFIDALEEGEEGRRGTRQSHLQIVFLKAGVGEKAELPELGWFDALREKYPASTVDIATDTGTCGLVYITPEKEAVPLTGKFPAAYGERSFTDVLAAEQNPDDLLYPNASPVRAHVFAERGLQESLQFLGKRRGAVVRGKMALEGKLTDVRLRYEDGKLAYAGRAPDGAPDASALQENPGRYIVPRSLRVEEEAGEPHAGEERGDGRKGEREESPPGRGRR